MYALLWGTCWNKSSFKFDSSCEFNIKIGAVLKVSLCEAFEEYFVGVENEIWEEIFFEELVGGDNIAVEEELEGDIVENLKVESEVAVIVEDDGKDEDSEGFRILDDKIEDVGVDVEIGWEVEEDEDEGVQDDEVDEEDIDEDVVVNIEEDETVGKIASVFVELLFIGIVVVEFWDDWKGDLWKLFANSWSWGLEAISICDIWGNCGKDLEFSCFGTDKSGGRMKNGISGCCFYYDDYNFY